MEKGKLAHRTMSMPLVSRLDHLESIMKDLESKQNLAKWSSNSNNSLLLREAYFKGSLLDRVASLETRLYQLCLESTTTTRTPSQGSKKEPSCSLPTFSNNLYQAQKHEPCPQVLVNSSEIQGQHSKKVEQTRKHASSIKDNKDEKTCKSWKKRVSSSWPHLKILGC